MAKLGPVARAVTPGPAVRAVRAARTAAMVATAVILVLPEPAVWAVSVGPAVLWSPPTPSPPVVPGVLVVWAVMVPMAVPVASRPRAVLVVLVGLLPAVLVVPVVLVATGLTPQF